MKKADFKQYLSEVKGFEVEYISLVLKSRRNAWIITFLFFVIGTLGIVGGIIGFYQKSPDPLVLRVNESTGIVELITTMKHTEQSYGEIVDNYFIAQYIINRESYNYYSVQNAYDLVQLMSIPAVFNGYRDLILKFRPDKIYMANADIAVKIDSMIVTPQENSARIHFRKQVVSNGISKEIFDSKSYIATLTYGYKNFAMTESMRLKNPLGFQINSYRIDEVFTEERGN